MHTGQNKLLFRTGLNSPVNIAIMDNQIFWTSRKSNRLSWADKKQKVFGIQGMNLRKHLILLVIFLIKKMTNRA